MSEPRRITERYSLEKRVSSNEQASVYRAIDSLSGETVAVKLIGAGDVEEKREQFQAAARTLQAIHHPCLPRLLDSGLTTAGSAFLVTEYLDGTGFETLAGAPADRVVKLLLAAVDGLEAMAAAGLAHGNLKADNLLFAGEEVKILGLGTGVLRSEHGTPDEDFARDRRDFALLAAQILPGAAGAALRRDPEALLVSWDAVRQALRGALESGRAAEAGTATVSVPRSELRQQMVDELKTRVFLPEDLAPPPPAPPAPTTAPPLPPPRPMAPTPPPRAGSRNPLWLLAAGGALGLVILVVVMGTFGWRTVRRLPASSPTAVIPQAPTPPVALPATPQPRAANPQIPLAEGFVAAGDLAKAKEALAALPPDSALSPTELERVQRVRDAMAPLETGAEARALARALSAGDARELRSAIEAIRPDQEAALPAAARRNLARARKVLDLDAQLARAEKTGQPLDVIRQAAALLAEQPRNNRAAKARDEAAAAVEADADAKAKAGDLEAAAARLEQLRDAWPDRDGLAARIAGLRAEQKTNQDMENLLTAVAKAEKAGKPLDGLQLLRGTTPSARFAERFRAAKARLEAQLAQLDRNPPEVKLLGGAGNAGNTDHLTYDKGAAFTLRLRITDDLGVETCEAWARPEGGTYGRVQLRRGAGGDYELEIKPELHQNKTVDLYVIATDRSGHQGHLGDATHPIQVKRRGFVLEDLRR